MHVLGGWRRAQHFSYFSFFLLNCRSVGVLFCTVQYCTVTLAGDFLSIRLKTKAVDLHSYFFRIWIQLFFSVRIRIQLLFYPDPDKNIEKITLGQVFCNWKKYCLKVKNTMELVHIYLQFWKKITITGSGVRRNFLEGDISRRTPLAHSVYRADNIWQDKGAGHWKYLSRQRHFLPQVFSISQHICTT